MTANADVRTVPGAGNLSTDAALSLYNDGGGNVQRTWLNFDLGAYSNKAITSDVTLTLKAQTYNGDYPTLTGVTLGTADAAWTSTGITHANQPTTTTVPGVTNPSGNFNTGDNVTWTIPWYFVEKWATAGYNGLGLKSGAGSTLHFDSSRNGGTPTLTLTSADGANGTWTGGSGNWTDSANWASSTVAQGINRSATIEGGTAVTVTMDANRSVGSLSFSNADHIISGSGKLALVTSSGTPSVTVGSAANATISTQVVGMDGLQKLGMGKLTLSGANSYTGITTVSAGTLSLASSSSLPTTGAVTIGSGAVLSNDASSGTSFNLGALTLNGGTLAATATPASNLGNFHLKGDVTVGGSSMSTISADVRVIHNETRSFNVGDVDGGSGVDLLVSGKLGHYNGNSWGYATKNGAGIMKLTGPVEIGGITVSAGKLVLEDSAADWSAFEGTNGGLKNNSEVEISVTTGSRSAGVVISGGGTLAKTGAGTLTLTGGNSYSGATTVNGGTLVLSGAANANNSDITMANSANLTFAATGSRSFTRSINGAAGDVTFNVAGNTSPSGGGDGTNFAFQNSGSFTGNVVINSGLVAPSSDSAFGNAANVIKLNAASGQSAGLVATNSITLPSSRSIQLANSGGTGTFRAYSGNTFEVAGEISGAGNLEKTDGGTLVLSGVSTYTGATLVSAGTLLVNGELGATAVTVASGATIGGSGAIAGSLNFGDGAKLTVNLADPLSISGLVSFANFGFDDLIGWDYTSAANGVYTLLAGNNVDLSSGVSNVGLANALDLGGGRSAYFQEGSLQVVVIPEPRAALLGGLGMLMLLRRRRA